MKLILTAVLAVALLGAATAVAVPGDGDTSDGTVAVDTFDIDSVFVALTIDADTAHQQVERSLFDRSSGVPVFASVARVFANAAFYERTFMRATLNELVDDLQPRLSQHSGKPYADGNQPTCEQCHVRLALAPHLYPLLC